MFETGSSQLVSAPPKDAPETTFVRYSLEDKEASLVTLSFDSSCHFLWVTSAQGNPVPLDLFHLKVNCFVVVVVCYCCLHY